MNTAITTEMPATATQHKSIWTPAAIDKSPDSLRALIRGYRLVYEIKLLELSQQSGPKSDEIADCIRAIELCHMSDIALTDNLIAADSDKHRVPHCTHWTIDNELHERRVTLEVELEDFRQKHALGNYSDYY